MMKKIVYNNYGGPEVLKEASFPIPEPKENEVLVKIMAAGINPIDYKMRNGSMKLIAPGKFPRTPGGEIAGIVEKNGSQSSRFKKGDKVYAMLTMYGGGYSEYLCVKEDFLSAMPDNLDFASAAAIPLAGLTALQSLTDLGNLRSGMSVLVNGASGGVGVYAIQIAKAYSADVTAVCSGKNADFVKDLGADRVIDYQKEDFTRDDQEYDIVFDAVAMSSYGKTKNIIKKGGAYVTTVPSPSVMLRQVFNFASGKKVYGILCKPGGNYLDILNKLIQDEKLRVSIEKSYTLGQASEAHKHIENGRVRGKLVIIMDNKS